MPAAIPLVAAAFTVAEGLAAVGAAAGMAATAAGGVAALSAGGLSALTLTGGLMIAGGGLTAVGALTGNKKLMTIGSIMGLAGGVGNLLSKGAETAATTAAPDAAKEVAGASTTANVGGEVVQGPAAEGAKGAAEVASNVAADAAAPAAAPLAGGASPSSGLISDAVKGPAGLVEPGSGPFNFGQAPATEALAGAPDASSLASSAPAGPAYATDAAAGVTTAPGSEFGIGQPTGAGDQLAMANQAPGAGAPSQNPTTGWGKVKEFFSDAAEVSRKNPALTQVGGAFLFGAMNNYSQQSMVADQRKRDDWLRQRYNESVRNLRIPGLVQTAGASGGIIGGARG